MSNTIISEINRPRKINDVLSHHSAKDFFKKSLDFKSMQHLIINGNSGIGKTSIIQAFCRDYYGENYNNCVLELNASDDRGINIIRSSIKKFCSIKSYQGQTKIVILDEFDNMTNDAQYALRRIIEKYVSNVRFILICNYLCKIIPAIYSRCSVIKLTSLDLGEIETSFKSQNIETKYIKELFDLCDCDLRKMYTFIDIFGKRYSIDDIYSYVFNITFDDYRWIWDYSQNDGRIFEEVFDFLKKKQLNITNLIDIYKFIYKKLKKNKHLYLLSNTQYKFIKCHEVIYNIFLMEICYINML